MNKLGNQSTDYDGDNIVITNMFL